MRKIKNLFGLVCLLLAGLTVGYASAVGLTPTLSKGEGEKAIEKTAGVYTAKIGTRELTGNNDGAFVNECLAVTGLDNAGWIKKTGKGYDWCAAFVSWTFLKADVTALRNAWAPSWFPTSKTIYTKGKAGNQKPLRADVFGIWYPTKNLIGHVGFIDQWPDGDYVITVEGNWGGQVARNRRLKDNIYKVSRWAGTKT